MKVVFAIPAYDGAIKKSCTVSLLSVQKTLIEAGIAHDFMFLSGCCYITAARNRLVADFLKTNGTELFFIDADVGFTIEGVLKLLKRTEDIVAGIYPMKTPDEEAYPVVVKTDNQGYPMGRDGLIEATGLPTGFMRIKRRVLEKMCESYPERKYIENGQEIYDLFNTGVENGRWWGDDLAFCNLWRRIGGQMWVEPDIDFSHAGNKDWKGNYHQFLLNCPKEQA